MSILRRAIGRGVDPNFFQMIELFNMFRLEQIIPATGPNPPWLVGERQKPSDGTPPSEEGAPPLAGGQNPITPQS